ncbi:phosphoglycerate kinase [Sporomusa sp.]|uniref:phosphoglycerate kinase n=1 Tax=Sporomusa sp. TaxID=2078658 RepID=UPI002C480711|nr:phosphoglycerate kinase [Sporomusa sp.]HWR45863.1 phosphoglycerate kinase [Sporomusa sp.]
MKFGMCTLSDFDVTGKTVLCRVDINQPIDRKTGTLKDVTRIKGCIPTLKELSERNAKTVLLAHQGGDLEYKNYFTTKPHAKILSDFLGRTVKFIDDVTGPAAREMINNLEEGEILLLDNVRFVSEEMTLFETKLNLNEEDQSKTQVVQKLAPLADLFVCDAFAAAHRSQPSLVGFEQVLPSAMGRLFEKEFSVIADIMESPSRPCLFILGGAKIQDAFMMMNTALKNGVADKVLTGGLVGNIMLLAKGIDIGVQSTDLIKKMNLTEYVEIAREILDKFSNKILLPVDLAYVEGDRKEVAIADLPVKDILVDIGSLTAKTYKKAIKEASTIFVNGPMGIFESEPSEHGTKVVWEALAESAAYSVLGGGDSITAANKYKVEERISYICTGGGALIRFLSGEELPVVKALRYAANKFGCEER